MKETKTDSSPRGLLSRTRLPVACRWLPVNSMRSLLVALPSSTVGSLGGRVKVFGVNTRAVVFAVGLRHWRRLAGGRVAAATR